MAGNILSTQMRRFRKLNAQRQTDQSPAPAVRPPRLLIPPPRGRGNNSSKQSDESRGEGVGRRMEEGRRWIRAVVLVHILVIAPSCRHFIPSRHLPSWLVSSPHPPHFRSVRRSRLLVARRLAPSSRSSSRSPSRSSSRRHPARRRPVPRFVSRPVVSFLVPFPVSFLIRRLVPAPRFLDTVGRGVFSFDGGLAGQASTRAWRGMG